MSFGIWWLKKQKHKIILICCFAFGITTGIVLRDNVIFQQVTSLIFVGMLLFVIGYVVEKKAKKYIKKQKEEYEKTLKS
jgi:uncharacterized membrane protein YbjE (DUF340 family)